MRITINKLMEYCEKSEDIALNCSNFAESRDRELCARYMGEASAFSEIASMLKNPEHFKAMYDIVCKDK